MYTKFVNMYYAAIYRTNVRSTLAWSTVIKF